MPSKKNSVLIFEPQIFLKKTLTDQNLTFHLKNMKYSAAYFHMTTCGIFPFFFSVRGVHAPEVKGCDFSRFGRPTWRPGHPS